MQARALGKTGEVLAARYLTSHGYEVIRENFTVRGGEIDLIARRNGILVFVEVKTRTNTSFGDGNESVNRLKHLRMQRAINRYLSNENDPDYRIDIIEIELTPETQTLKEIRHFEDIEV